MDGWYNAAMIDSSTFNEWVQEALSHLYDHAYLQSHPLSSLLAAGPEGQAVGRTLHRVLFESVEDLKPPRGTPTASAVWRRYNYLFLRYVETLGVAAVATRLGISERQSRRCHREALAAVAELLWGRYSELLRGGVDAGRAEDEATRTRAMALRAEVAKVGSARRSAPVEVGEVLGSALATLRPLAQEKGVTIGVGIDEGLPGALVDRGVLRQALLEILLYGLFQWPASRIQIGATGTPGYVEIALSVSRPGEARASAPDAAPTQGPSNDRLAVGRQLLDTQGGRVDVRGSRDGTTISVSLPAADAATVLLIDDNADVRQLFRRYLAGGSYRVVDAKDAEQALRLAVETNPDVIVLDVMMPSSDGWEVLQNLKSHPRLCAVPVVVCSVLDERELALSLGAADLIAKPVTQQVLLAAVERYRGTRGGRQG